MKRQNTGYEDGNYGLPAGHLEDNETLKQGLVRESKEELGIDIDVNDIRLVHTMHRHETDSRVDFFFEATTYCGIPTNSEPQKCANIKWFPLDKLPKNIIPYIQAAISHYQNKLSYSEVGWTKE